jgi:hypothetical protein
MADSVGQGIALGERFKFDTTSGTALLNKAVQDKFANDRKQEADFVDALDFKVDYSKTLPAYGKAMTEAASGLLNKYNQYKKENPRTAKNRIQADAYATRMELGRLQRDNDANLAYINQPAGTLRNNEYIKTVTSMDSNLSDLAKYNDGRFLNVGQKGEFAFKPVPEIKPASIVKYDDKDYSTTIRGSKPSNVPGKMEVEYYDDVIPDAVRRNAEALMATPGFIDNVIWNNPGLKDLPEKEQLAASFDAAFDIATKLKRSSTSDWRLADLPNPSGSGSNDKREKPVIVKNTKQTLLRTTGNKRPVLNPDDGNKPMKNDDGTPMMVDETVQKESDIPVSASVAGTPPITIMMDSRVIDATKNKNFKGDDLNQSVTFKPDNVYSENVLKTGKWEKYVLGQATFNTEKSSANGVQTTTEKVLTIKVPYDKVASAVEGKWDMSEFNKDFEELTKNPQQYILGSGNKSQTTPATKQTKTVIAPNNSVGIKPEM